MIGGVFPLMTFFSLNLLFVPGKITWYVVLEGACPSACPGGEKFLLATADCYIIV